MSNFALTTFILLVFLFAAGLALGRSAASLARATRSRSGLTEGAKGKNRRSPLTSDHSLTAKKEAMASSTSGSLSTGACP
jgi:hypothetical protein